MTISTYIRFGGLGLAVIMALGFPPVHAQDTVPTNPGGLSGNSGQQYQQQQQNNSRGVNRDGVSLEICNNVANQLRHIMEKNERNKKEGKDPLVLSNTGIQAASDLCNHSIDQEERSIQRRQ